MAERGQTQEGPCQAGPQPGLRGAGGLVPSSPRGAQRPPSRDALQARADAKLLQGAQEMSRPLAQE